MSRAFVKESEGDPDVPIPEPVLPPGARNVITRGGAARLRAERGSLFARKVEIKAAGRTEDAAELREIERRLAYLDKRIPTFVEVEHQDSTDRVMFGCAVTVSGDGGERTWRIVGVDEIDPENGDVSWASPIGRALIGAREGDVVIVRGPRGDEEVEITRIDPPHRGQDARVPPG